MKQFLLILRYFFTFERSLFWFSGLGIFITLALILARLFYPDFPLSNSEGRMGNVFFIPLSVSLLFPYMGSAGAFRALISNQQLAFLPFFHLKVGLTLLLFTIVLSLSLSTAGLLKGTPLVPLLIFFTASLFSALIQLIISKSATQPWLQGLPIFIYFVGFYNYELIYALIQDPNFTLILTAICLLGWLKALHILFTQRIFKSSKIEQNQRMSVSTSFLFKHKQIEQFKSAAEALLTNSSDTLKTKIKKNVVSILIAPFAAAVVLTVIFSLISQAETQNPPFFLILFMINFLSSVILPLTCSDYVAFTRRLWLRQGSNRKWQWQQLEKTLALDFLLIAVISLPVYILLSLVTEFTLDKVVAYFFLSQVYILFNYYSTLTLRIYSWPSWTNMVLVLISLTVICILAFMIAVDADLIPFIIKGELGIFISALIFRYFAQRGFKKINWLVVKPALINRQLGMLSQKVIF